MIKSFSNIFKSRATIYFLLLGIMLMGISLVTLFLFPSGPKFTNQQQSSSNKSKELGNKVENILNKIKPQNSNIQFIVNITDQKSTTPAQTLKINKTDTFELTLESSYFIESDKFNTDFIKRVVIHEFAHILSLQNQQFDTFNSTDFNPSNKSSFDLAETKCLPNYFNIDGCLEENSYLSKFYKRFWTGSLRAEYDKIQNIEDKEQFNDSLSRWGDKYNTSFVSKNAFVSPEEDLAESFSIWVLNYNTESLAQIQKDKVGFFNSFDELKVIKENYEPIFNTEFNSGR